jgi:hypothetical protein
LFLQVGNSCTLAATRQPDVKPRRISHNGLATATTQVAGTRIRRHIIPLEVPRRWIHTALEIQQLDTAKVDAVPFNNWTSSGEGSVQVGHHDRTGGGQNPTSWNSAHGSWGCSQENLQGSGGNGPFYCFAVN